MASDWIRQQLTLPNILLIGTVLIGVGGYKTSINALESRVSALEQAREPAVISAARQDEALKAIREQLAEIKADVKDIKQRQ